MSKHISEQYDIELSQIREQLMEMGGLVEKQVDGACQAIVRHDMALAHEVREVESRLNQFEVELDDQCVSIIAKRQPAASDLRAVVSVMKAITDLERVGDEADRIAKMALALVGTPIPADQYADFRHLHGQVVALLNRALDAFARLDDSEAQRVIADDEAVDDAYDALVRSRIGQMQDQPDGLQQSLNIIWAARALERVGDHAKNISEYVIYQVQGQDIRHAQDVEAL